MFQWSFKRVSRVFKRSLRGVSGKFQWSFKGVSRKIKGCFNGVLNGRHVYLKYIQTVFEGSCKGHRCFIESFKGVSRKFPRCFKENRRVF